MIRKISCKQIRFFFIQKYLFVVNQIFNDFLSFGFAIPNANLIIIDLLEI